MNKYYAVLGLPTNASKDEVRKKYRQLVLIWHPDRNPSPEAHGKFIAITEAYDILMGERAAPRTKISYSWPKQQRTAPPTQKKATKAELLRRKFDKIRNDHRNSRDAARRKKEMETKAQTYFILTGLVGLAAIVLPFLLGSYWHLIWLIPVSFGFGAQLLWRGGRFKIRSEMIFGPRNNFTDEEIAEFFIDRPGFGGNSMSGDDNNYY